MAFGLGWPLRCALDPAWRRADDHRSRRADAGRGRVMQLALGLAAALWLDASLGAVGALVPLVAWSAIAIGAVLAIASLRGTAPRDARSLPIAPTSWLWLAALPALAALAVAACSAPGWLWSSEFGGYDALGYHLELPKQWLADERIRSPTHNVYGCLPSFVESAYLHVMTLSVGGGDDASRRAQGAAVACQWLHALLAIAAAWATGVGAALWKGGEPEGERTRSADAPVTSTIGTSMTAIIAGITVLATPWVVVVGSLAYNEMAVCLFLAAGLALLAPGDDGRRAGIASSAPDRHADWRGRWRLSASLGVLVGAACGAKLTSALFVAAPLAALAVVAVARPTRGSAARSPIPRGPAAPRLDRVTSDAPTIGLMRAGANLLACAIIASACAAAMLAPWLVRNGLDTGNPLFPFATRLLGTAHWSAEQVAIFARGHASDASLGERLVRFAQQVPLYGLGANPEPGEPWLPQWAATPWLALLAWAMLVVRRGTRTVALGLGAVLAIQAGAWMLFTHLQSRFFLPAVVPMAMLTGIAGATLLERARRSAAHVEDGSARSTLPSVRRAAIGTGAAFFALLALACGPLALLRREARGAPAAAIGQADVFTGDAEAAMLASSDASIREAIRRDASPALVVNHLLPRDARILLVGESRPFWLRGGTERIVWQTTWDRGPLSALLRAHPDDPVAWTRGLRAAGFTHVLVDPAMLDRWARSGWNDPLLDGTSAMRLAEPPNRVEHRFVNGAAVITLLDR